MGTSLEPRWLEGVGWWVDSFRSACVAATVATIMPMAILL